MNRDLKDKVVMTNQHERRRPATDLVSFNRARSSSNRGCAGSSVTGSVHILGKVDLMGCFRHFEISVDTDIVIGHKYY